MKFSVRLLNSYHIKAMNIPEWHKSLTWTQQIDAVKLAEELGYDRVKTSEHFVINREHVEVSGDHFPHAATALAVLAGATKKITLSSSITILPLVNPIAQAKIWSTLDWLSGGRARMCVGVGWLKEEYDIMGVNFHERGAMCDEYVGAIRELWTSDHPTFEGKYVNFRDVGFAPKPVQKPTIPIWFGGDAPPVLRRIARHGDGWQPHMTPLDKLGDAMDYIRSQKNYHGRPIEVEYSMINFMVGDNHAALDAPDSAKGTWNVEQTLDFIGQLKDYGITETALEPPSDLESYEAYLDWLRWGAENILPKAG